MSASRPAGRPRSPSRPGHSAATIGDRLVAAGAALFGLGVVAALLTVAPLMLGGPPRPLGFYLAATLAPAGFVLALVGMVRANRARRTGPGSRPTGAAR